MKGLLDAKYRLGIDEKTRDPKFLAQKGTTRDAENNGQGPQKQGQAISSSTDAGNGAAGITFW